LSRAVHRGDLRFQEGEIVAELTRFVQDAICG